MLAARAAAASRSSPSWTTTRAISTPCSLSMLKVATPKWREPTRVIRMLFLSRVGENLPVDYHAVAAVVVMTAVVINNWL
jgi:hypothetical protein